MIDPVFLDIDDLLLIVEGGAGAEGEIDVIERPEHDLTIRDVLRIFAFDHRDVARLVAVPQLSESWRGWARHLLEKASHTR